MRLHIETWVSEKQFSMEVNTLFEESAKCYKASAYRAALLFSFLAFQTIIKERVLKATKPDHINEHQWNAIHNNLRNDDNWDAEVIECIKKSDPNKKIFDISEDLRQQSLYWKNRRNDCAHSKRNIITDVHVESFWYFIKANLNQFVLPGSQSSLINKIKIHFDTNYTPEDKPFDYLIQECLQIIDQSNVANFIKFLFEMFEEENPFGFFSEDRELEFIESLIFADQIIASELTEKISQDEEFYLTFIDDRPSRIQYFLHYEEIIRKTWRVLMFKDSKVSLSLLASMLRYDVIPSDTRNEIYLRTVNKGFDLNVGAADWDTLTTNGFIEQLKQAVFVDYREQGRLLNNFEWANKKVRIALYYLKNFEIDEVIVRSIANTFFAHPYPFKARDAIRNFFRENTEIKEQFIKIAEEEQIILPDSLGFEEE
ncbi:hypothetical protein [Cytobacillus solani]|uniref:Uncharacterized protein n=1 Tax=Cytobacillus solani TaxID=1637975 RepID=A0A0Q3TX74_9BACI|nr:hypothetical protein [Cytobacillus solani]KQL27517.1 hypothetical protein AN957_00840 [Cytobacillus solani]